MAEYVANSSQAVALNSPMLFNSSIPCNRGCVVHENESGLFVLRGIPDSPNGCLARYQVTFNGNIEIPEGGAVTPIAVAIAVEGEPKLTSRAIFEPSGVEVFGNVTSTTIVSIPRGCCFAVSVEYVDATTDDAATTPTPVINVENANLVITKIL